MLSLHFKVKSSKTVTSTYSLINYTTNRRVISEAVASCGFPVLPTSGAYKLSSTTGSISDSTGARFLLSAPPTWPATSSLDVMLVAALRLHFATVQHHTLSKELPQLNSKGASICDKAYLHVYELLNSRTISLYHEVICQSRPSNHRVDHICQAVKTPSIAHLY